MSSENEAIVREATDCSNRVNQLCQEVFQSTRDYLNDRELKSQSSGKGSRKSGSSKRSRVSLRLQEEEIERQAAARKAILEAELFLKQMEIDEQKRQQIQKVRDQCELEDVSSESDQNEEEVNNLKTTEWVQSIPTFRQSGPGTSRLPDQNL